VEFQATRLIDQKKKKKKERAFITYMLIELIKNYKQINKTEKEKKKVSLKTLYFNKHNPYFPI
jgi:hypothetical protein